MMFPINKYVFALLLIPLVSFSQIIKGKIVDKVTNEPLIYANVALLSKNRGATSDELGEYQFHIDKDTQDSILVSYMGYKSFKFSLQGFTENKIYVKDIYLESDVSEIDEIIIDVKKARYSSIHTIGARKKKKFVKGTQFGAETCLCVKNQKYTKGKVNELIFFTKNRINTQFKTLPTYYRLKFYEFKYGKPGKLLSYDDILVKPKFNTKQNKIDLRKSQILFPVEGLCVGLETIKPQGVIRPENPMYITNPSLVWVHSKDSNVWTNYRGKKWNKNKRKSVFNKKFYTEPLFQLKVQYRK